ncbi:MAG: hypothetical protein IJE25_05070 [Clostridia bacterium]|nr:hypothetical protein [Clostridia bacterium]
MNTSFVSVLRAPDHVFGATESSPYRFEEERSASCDIKYEYKLSGDSAKVIVYPSGSPVKFLKLRFSGDMSSVESVFGDQWERGGKDAYLEWRSVMPHRALPWFCYARSGERIAFYGVRVGADCFAFWQIDPHGVTLFLNLCSANFGTDLKEPLTACEVVEATSLEGESAYSAAKRFSAMLCPSPRLPKEPVFGVNNWYWAYGNISEETILRETDYLMKMCKGTRHRPYMIIDDGWQKHRTFDALPYIGGPWLPNDRFSDMANVAEEIHSKGAKAGIWFRPLLTKEAVPIEARLIDYRGGVILDPTHPFTLEKARSDAATLRGWGFDLIKHDFTTMDILGWQLSADQQTAKMCADDRRLFDNTVTTATAIKRLYMAIQEGAGDAEVIGCNTVGHLAAGIHSISRIGCDTSGKCFEWTRRDGVNSMMRLPLNDTFFRADPDCAAFTEDVPAEANLDFLEMCALTGVTTLASVTPDILTESQLARINSIFRLADENTHRYGIKHYERCANPEIFLSEDGRAERAFDWERPYHGARSSLEWLF